MKKSIIIIALVLLARIASASVIDAPHNAISCSTCHSFSLWWQYSPTSQSPAPNDHTALVDTVCMTCHKEGTGGPPKALTHSSTIINSTLHGVWGVGCTACHNPHSQDQLKWIGSASEPYLVTGTISAVSYNSSLGQSTITYANATENPKWPAAGDLDTDPDWGNKSLSNPNRGLILVHDKTYAFNTFSIISATPSQIIIQGELASTAVDPNYINEQTHIQNSATSNTFGLIYGQLIKESIASKPVKFFDPTGGFVIEGANPTGICQVCHTKTTHFTNTGALPSGTDSHTGRAAGNCTSCHKHNAGFKGSGHDNTSFAWAGNCATCHDAGHSIVSIAAEIHGRSCGLCHLDPAGGGPRKDGDPANGIDGSALGATNASTCVDCHLTKLALTGGAIHHVSASGYAAAGNCTRCHQDAPGKLAANHASLVAMDGNCTTTCHTATAGTPAGAPVDPANPKIHDACISCHEITGPLKAAYGKASAMPPGGGNCEACHGAYFPNHVNADHYTRIAGSAGCLPCHSGNVGQHDKAPVNPADNKVHDGCTVCHDADGTLKAAYGKAIAMPAQGGSCTDCHGAYFVNHDNITHVDRVATNANCSECHADTVGTPTGAPVSTTNHKLHKSCAACHDTAAGTLLTVTAPGGSGAISAGDCVNCHGAYFASHSNIDHQSRVAGADNCISCHTETAGTATTVPVNTTDNKVHDACSTCHNPNGSLKAAYGRASAMPSGGGNCEACHGTATHETSHDHAALGYDTNKDGAHDEILSCQTCHYQNILDEHTTRRNLPCAVCHGSSAAKVSNAIAAGLAGGTVFCDACHNTMAGEPAGNLVAKHHLTKYSASGNCTKCHVVGPGERGPHRPPCWYCHGAGKPGDPQRPAAGKHANGPAISKDGVDDFRVCFSCHLAGGQGYVSGVTPLVTPMHGLPGTGPDYSNVYWPFGYYKDTNNQWQASDPLIPTDTNPTIPANLENDPVRWWTWPGWHVLNYLGAKKNQHSTTYNDSSHPDVQNWARSGANPIRNVVGSDYNTQDYPTVSIRNGGVFEVPSFDGTGSIGKPTGSGSVAVTISPAAAVTAGAQWRLDGGPWKNSGATLTTVTDRDNHLLEFKPVAGMDEPPPVQVTVANGQTTALNGSVTTYSTCPADCRLQAARTSGDTALAFDWTRPEQEETFQATGWRSGPVECEVWRQSGGALVAAEGFVATTAASGDSCRLSKDGATPAGSYDLVLRVTGSSCFRNTIDLPLEVAVTAAGAPSPVGQADGMIGQPFLDSLALPSTNNQDILHLAGNLYAHLNQDGVISTFTMDDLGNISPVLASTNLWGGSGTFGVSVKMARVSDTLIAVSYNLQTWDSGTSSYTYANHIMTIGIEQNGTAFSKKQDYLFQTGSSIWWPQIYPHHDNSNLFIVTWGGYSSYSYYNGIVTVQINQFGGITELARDLTMPASWSEKSDTVHIAGNKYAFVRNQYINLFEVSSSGAITILGTPGSQYQYATDGYYATMARVKDNIFAVTYIKNYVVGPGMLKTISISDSGVISGTVNTYMFTPDTLGYPPQLVPISDRVIGVYYLQSGVNLKTFEITGDGRIMVPYRDAMNLSGGGSNPKLLPVGGDIFAFLLNGDQSQGVSFSGVKTYKISHDPDQDGIATSADNCPDQANTGQADADGDGVGDVCDACPGQNDKADADHDGVPDACDICAGHDDKIDSDHDGTPDGCDPCPNDPANDADHDGVCAGSGYNAPQAGDNDNCPAAANANQLDSDCDNAGDACSAPLYYPPNSLVGTAVSSSEVALTWHDALANANGYRIERKAESCTASSLSFAPVAALSLNDAFDNGIDSTAWVQGAVVKTASTRTSPARVSDASGSAEVSPVNGSVRLHTVATNMNDGGYNDSYIEVKGFAKVIGDRDFDMQADYSLPFGTITATEYHIYARMHVALPPTSGGNNDIYLERSNNGYLLAIQVNGVYETAYLDTNDINGALRLVRSNRQLAGYIWKDSAWVLLKQHSQPLIANLVPTWAGIVQYARLNDPVGMNITTDIDNFRFNVIGGQQPQGVLAMNMDENAWAGVAGEVKDTAAAGTNGQAKGGATTVIDAERGRVGSFDGNDDYVEIPGNGTLAPVTRSSFTFAAWAKPADAPPATQTAPPGNDWVYAIMTRSYPPDSMSYSRDKTFSFYAYDTAWGQIAASDPTPHDPGVWHHLVGVVDDAGKTVKLYVDGQEKGSTSYAGRTLFNHGTSPYLVGISNPGGNAWVFPFKGKIDDARIFDRALSASEVTALFNSTRIVDSGLAANTTYCYRVYPYKSDTCEGWANHAATFEVKTLTSVENNRTTAGTATAVVLRGSNALAVNMPWHGDGNGNNTYTVEYKLSSDTAWTTQAAEAPHTASPYATTIPGLTPLATYDVRLTYADPDGVSGTAQQLLKNISISAAPSCLAIRNAGGSVGDGAYWLDADGDGGTAPYQAYCDMTTDGGGWTLAMKLDGSQTTFQYSANYWTTANTLNPGSPGFDTTQAKLQSFNTVAFTQVRLGMRNYSNPADDIDWITVNQAAGSLVALFNGGYVATSVGRDNWLNLLEGINTQPNCNKEGFNAEQSYSKMRIGLAMNQEADCTSCDRILGFGNAPSGHPWGAWAVVGGGYPGSNTVAYGWIMVR